MKKDDCIFCKIANGEIGSDTVYEDDMFRVILDLNPGTRGHMLILPKEHYDDIYELPDEVSGRLMGLARKLACAARKGLSADGVNLVQNNGEAAGQTVKHFHMHVIPRYADGSEPIVTWTPHDSDPAEQKELAKRLSDSME